MTSSKNDIPADLQTQKKLLKNALKEEMKKSAQLEEDKKELRKKVEELESEKAKIVYCMKQCRHLKRWS